MNFGLIAAATKHLDCDVRFIGGLVIDSLIEEVGLVSLDINVTREVLCLLGHVAHDLDNINKFGTASRSHHDDGCHNNLEHCAHGDPQAKILRFVMYGKSVRGL